MSTAAIHDDFRFEWDQEQQRRLRVRVQWYAAVNVVISLISVTIGLLAADDLPTDRWLKFLLFGSSALTACAYGWVFVDAYGGKRHREDQLRVLGLLLAVTTVIGTTVAFVHAFVQIDAIAPRSQARDWGVFRVGMAFAAMQIVSIFWTHFFACLFLPWTPRESLRPMFPVLAVTAGCLLALAVIPLKQVHWTLLAAVGLIIGACAVLLPGLAIAWWKNNRFAREFLVQKMGTRYGELQRELSGAQRIHQALFPKPDYRSGLRFDYRYVPMRGIGGDYLYARFVSTDDRAEPSLVCVVLDVTGHGITAALTVNRLHGELERVIAEHPDIHPTELLRTLNRYVYLTLADYSLFVTAIAFRVESASPGGDSQVHYANAGHPPAFVRRANPPAVKAGAPDPACQALEPTAMVLGVSRDLDVDLERSSITLHPGDTLIAYTDGAMEARNSHGKMLNVEGIQSLVAGAPMPCSNLCDKLMGAIAAHRFGPPSDDTLLVEITRIGSSSITPTSGFSPAQPASGHTTSATQRHDAKGDTRTGERVVASR